jgi:hypothetical protein
MPDRAPGSDGPLESLYPPEYFALLAGHHLRLADRHRTPTVFIFVRVEDGGDDGDPLAASEHAAEVVLDAVRSSDVPTRIDDRTFAVLLTGEAAGAEDVVLSRIVEAIARGPSGGTSGREISLSVGTARYEPGSGVSLDSIVQSAVRRMSSDER